MNVNIYYTIDYKNELAVRQKKTNPIKANAGSLGDLFDYIEIFVFKTKLKMKILILQDRLDILLDKALRLIR